MPSSSKVDYGFSVLIKREERRILAVLNNDPLLPTTMPTPSNPTTYTVTAALPYANGPIHIGHLAGVYIPADIYVRYLRSCDRRVLFISGSDEHGVPVTIRAQQEGTTPQQVVDKYHALNKKAFEDFGISFDCFSRTSSALHHKIASDFFKTLCDNGRLEIKETDQYYDPVHNQFLADRYIRGTCPICAYQDAYGDQCESCGTTLSPEELLKPRSYLSGATLQLKKTHHWYLPLEQHEDWLKRWILEEHSEWKDNVYGQCKSWLTQGLQPRAVTRDLAWGIPVPLPNAQNKVLYVWFDAPIGYISASQAWAAEQGKDWVPFWKDPDTRLIHFVGKDNIVFHCIIFPAMMQAHGGFILPTNVPANEFLNLEGKKISTSQNWAVWLHEYLTDFPDQQDVLRYALCSNAPENKDSDFSWKDLQAKNNNELVAILGNFVHRTLVLVHKYFGGIVPERSTMTDAEYALDSFLQQLPQQIGNAIEQFRFKQALQLCMNLARAGNKYLADTEPWHLIATEPTRVRTILNTALQLTANLVVFLAPFLPFTSRSLERLLQTPLQETVKWPQAGHLALILPGTALKTPTLLFEKITDEQIEIQKQKLHKMSELR
jgi:methionyl-tRNA synthetase